MALARPIPVLPPVINAVLPVSLDISVSLSDLPTAAL